MCTTPHCFLFDLNLNCESWQCNNGRGSEHNASRGRWRFVVKSTAYSVVYSIQSYSAVDTEEFVVHIIELSIVKVKFIIVSILQFMVWFKQSVQCTVNSE